VVHPHPKSDTDEQQLRHRGQGEPRREDVLEQLVWLLDPRSLFPEPVAIVPLLLDPCPSFGDPRAGLVDSTSRASYRRRGDRSQQSAMNPR